MSARRDAGPKDEGIPEEEERPRDERGTSEDKNPCATLAEKIAAYNRLLPAQLASLYKYARFCNHLYLSGKVHDVDEEDLINEAMERVFNKRQWYPSKVDFRWFVREVIRSVTSDWSGTAKITESPDDLLSPDNFGEKTENSITLDKMREAIKEFPLLLQIFDLIRLGWKPRDIQNKLRLRPDAYASNVLRMKRILRGGFYNE